MSRRPPQLDAADDDSLTHLEHELDRSIAQLAHQPSQISLASGVSQLYGVVPNVASDLSSDDEKYETFSLGAGRRASDLPSLADERSAEEKRIDGKDDASNASEVRREPWWRFQSQTVASGEDHGADADVNATNDDSSSSSSDERGPTNRHSFCADTKEKSQASTQSAERLPWWQNPFRRYTTPGDRPDTWKVRSTSSIVLSQDQLRMIQATNTFKTKQNNAVPSAKPDSLQEDAEFNQLLFPRRGSIQGFMEKRRPSSSSNGSTPSYARGSIRTQRSTQSNQRGSINSIDSHDPKNVDEVIQRNSINLGSIERALLADMVSNHENRWKGNIKSAKNASLASADRFHSSTILEEVDSISLDKSRRDNATAETQMETQMSPQSQERLLDSDLNDHNASDEDSLSSSGEVDSDGVYCSGWSVVGDREPQAVTPRAESMESLPSNANEYGTWVGEKEPKTNGPTDTLPPIDYEYGLWDTEALLALKNGVKLSRTNAIDDVSSIASSDHSGRITQAKHNRSLTYRRKNGQSLFSSQFSNWRGAGGKLSSYRARSISSSREDDEEEDDDLEGEVFAVSDAKYEAIVKEAIDLMDSVNKSVVSMGMEAPFRPMEEICPPFKKLHKNLLRQYKELKAVSSSDYDRWLQNTKQYRPKGRAPGLTVSLASETSDITGNSASEAPSLDDRKAVAAFIMNRIAAHETGSISKSPTDSKVHTAFLPNFMYYQFIAADPTSVIKPTSLCSGTGITGGEHYLKRDMLELFGMFGSYFVGAGHLFQEGEEADEDKTRRTPFYMEPIHEGESVGGESDASGLAASDDSEDDKRLEDTDTPDTHLSLELLESIIDELKRGQIQDMSDVLMGKEGPTPMNNKNVARGTSKVMENYEIRDRIEKSIQ